MRIKQQKTFSQGEHRPKFLKMLGLWIFLASFFFHQNCEYTTAILMQNLQIPKCVYAEVIGWFLPSFVNKVKPTSFSKTNSSLCACIFILIWKEIFTALDSNKSGLVFWMRPSATLRFALGEHKYSDMHMVWSLSEIELMEASCHDQPLCFLNLLFCIWNPCFSVAVRGIFRYLILSNL